MKSTPSIPKTGLFFTFFLLPVLSAWAIAPGDTRDDLMEELGAPPSTIEMGARDIYIYERGKVELVGDEVTKVELLSPEQWKAWQRRAAEAEAHRQAAEAKRLSELTETVRSRTDALRAHRLTPDPRLEYDAALQALHEEEDQLNREAERDVLLTRLEARVLQAQAAALQAEEDAASARERAARAETTAQRVRERQAETELRHGEACSRTHVAGETCSRCGFGGEGVVVLFPVQGVHHGVPVDRTAVTPRSVEEIGGRYSNQRRLGEEGPIFGGAPPRWGR